MSMFILIKLKTLRTDQNYLNVKVHKETLYPLQMA